MAAVRKSGSPEVRKSGLMLVIVTLCCTACVRSTTEIPARANTVPTSHTAPPVARTTWPALDHEPQLGILLLRGASFKLRLLQTCSLPDGKEIATSTINVRADGDGIQVGSHRFTTSTVVLTPRQAGATVSIGAAKFVGALELVRERSEVLLIERVGLETWLAGVLPVEMHPNWPIEALAAQAIVARSYAAARWQSRQQEPWHLVRGTADIAYGGELTPSPNVSAALASSRGLVLAHDGQAILARFHACSGGRTEDSVHLWPTATLVDGVTPLSRFMRSVDDPVSADGAKGLGWSLTHDTWKVSLPTAAVAKDLRTWSDNDRRRPVIRSVHAVAIAEREAGSNRVARVSVVHHGPDGERTDTMDALDFRLAVGASKVRSLWWERCVMTPTAVVIEGHGYGHGVGLPQVSAWQLAKQGVSAKDIILRYYNGVTLIRAWH
ncbi:MAG: SpoIID/LytB domain-containing protein [Planctomycetota bacterium]